MENLLMNIIMPLSGPGLATLCIFTFMHVWNDYLAPLITSDTFEQTIQLGLTAFMSERTMEYAPSGGTVCVIPGNSGVPAG